MIFEFDNQSLSSTDAVEYSHFSSIVSLECPGIEDGSELNTGNVMDFVNCTIITGNLIINFQSRSLR